MLRLLGHRRDGARRARSLPWRCGRSVTGAVVRSARVRSGRLAASAGQLVPERIGPFRPDQSSSRDVLEPVAGGEVADVVSVVAHRRFVDRGDTGRDLNVDGRSRPGGCAATPLRQALDLVTGEQRRSPVRSGRTREAATTHVGVQRGLGHVQEGGGLRRSDERAHHTILRHGIDVVNVDSINVDSVARWTDTRDMTQQLIDVPAGLNGVVAADTAIGAVDGDRGFFHYGGHDATVLARTRSFEDVWFLLRSGRLATDVESSAFRSRGRRTAHPADCACCR